jgi:hypothetical protein
LVFLGHSDFIAVSGAERRRERRAGSSSPWRSVAGRTTSKPKLAWRWLPPPPKFGGPPVTNIRNTSSPQWRGWLKPEMPALRTNRVGGGPLDAAVLDFIGEPEHRGDAGKCRGWRRGEPPICLVDDSARNAAALKRLLRGIRVDPILAFGFVLCIDRLAMGDIRRPLRVDQCEGRIEYAVCLEPNTPMVVENALEPIGRWRLGCICLGGGRDCQRGGSAAGGNSQEVPPRQIDGRDFGRVCGVLYTRLALAMEGLRWLGLEPGRKTEPFPPACFYVIN